jgi:hypothetical protein
MKPTLDVYEGKGRMSTSLTTVRPTITKTGEDYFFFSRERAQNNPDTGEGKRCVHERRLAG